LNSLDIDNFLSLLRRRWLVIAIVCAVGVGMMPLASAFIPVYRGTAQLLIVSQALKDTTLSDPDLPSIITSNEVLSRVISRLKLNLDPGALARKIKTKLPPKSSIISVTYKDTDQDRAVAITNAIADESSAYFHELAVGGYSSVLSALNKRIAESNGKIAGADRKLQLASAKNAFASSDKALDDLTAQIDDLRAQRGQVSSSLAADVATAAALQDQLRRIDPIVRGEILQKDVVYQQLLTGLSKDAEDLVSERSSFRGSFPGLSALARRFQRERQQVEAASVVAIKNGSGLSPSYTQTILDGARAAATVSADRERLHAIDVQLAGDQKHLQQVAGASAVVGTLRAQRDVALQQYVSLTQRLSAAQGDAAQGVALGTLVIVSRAVPGPSSLTLWLIAIAGLTLIVALGLAYAVDSLDRRLWGIREIEHVYGRPVLLEVVGDNR
jgi:capsular polysaccharide biosynthesis protein